jgi:hypothetical protein
MSVSLNQPLASKTVLTTTSARGPVIVEQDLVDALQSGKGTFHLTFFSQSGAER